LIAAFLYAILYKSLAKRIVAAGAVYRYNLWVCPVSPKAYQTGTKVITIDLEVITNKGERDGKEQ
jgi:hypothetical protein